MQSIILILVLFCPGLVFLYTITEGGRCLRGQIGRENTIKLSGYSLIQGIKNTEGCKLPQSDEWTQLAAIYYKPNPNNLETNGICYNVEISGQVLNALPPETVLLFEVDNILLKNGDKETFKKVAQNNNILLYTADSKIIKYLFHKDEFRVFETNEEYVPSWGK